MIAIAVLAGVLVGISLGALGGGGAIITVPILVYALGQTAHQATTGSLIIVGTTALIAALGHHANGRVRWAHGLLFGAIGTFGTSVGSRLSAGISANALLLSFAALLVLVATLMWRRASGGQRSEDGAESGPVAGRSAAGQIAAVVATAVAVGLLTGFFGVGGGFAVVPALVMVLGYPMPVAVGTSLLIVTINSATAFVERLGGGVDIDWKIIGVFALAAIIGSLAGTRVASRVPTGSLQRAFAVLLIVVAAYTGIRSGIAILG